MQALDNQKDYWNKVASTKTFTHPLNWDLLQNYFSPSNKILDYGCGYGRIVKELNKKGYNNVIGIDTSDELVLRGKNENNLNLQAIASPTEISNLPNLFDAVILFAVLTCIPSNEGQKNLISLLSNQLNKDGIIYISDYYLQSDSQEMNRYEYFNGDENNYGTFSLAEGATFRHHTREWIQELLASFDIIEENNIEVKTMNGHTAEAFQIIAKKK
ncbi:bifunctional 2-polyprenyl-6-hydroxyphenol methylase/3-demethylubiquinol 3-O-methyltransferase UbiG [Flavobacterium sp. H122]|uniref:class I SAM-dependent methyltransferase n=1 Tax=Flavobacterium sp. H122 TaxID=2529860 RepID=UPI0010AA5206|nr:class I SAM-dependent methyltransferase [Flavobacterium sp. H122]